MDFSRLNRSKGVKLAAAAVGGAAALGATVAAAQALQAPSNGVIDACYDRRGNLRIVAANEACNKTETAISWNQEGPQGPIGPMGAQGVPGTPGAQGAAGPAGPAGAQGPAGPQGSQGPAGPEGPAGGGGVAAAFDSVKGPDCAFYSAAGSDIFLKLDDIKGESADSKHPGEIEILAAGFTAKNGAFISGSSGAGQVGSSTFGTMCLLKPLDASTPVLLEALASGRHLRDAEFTFRKAGTTSVEYLTIKLTDILVSSYTPSGGDRPMETFSLNFDRVVFEHTSQDQKGGAGPRTSFGWDLSAKKGI